ncbi:unnamed protein product [Closterium sp. NIES-53]
MGKAAWEVLRPPLTPPQSPWGYQTPKVDTTPPTVAPGCPSIAPLLAALLGVPRAPSAAPLAAALPGVPRSPPAAPLPAALPRVLRAPSAALLPAALAALLPAALPGVPRAPSAALLPAALPGVLRSPPGAPLPAARLGVLGSPPAAPLAAALPGVLRSPPAALLPAALPGVLRAPLAPHLPAALPGVPQASSAALLPAGIIGHRWKPKLKDNKSGAPRHKRSGSRWKCGSHEHSAMANIQSTSSARNVLTFAGLYSTSIWAVILPLPRLAEAVALSDVLAQIRDQARFPSKDLSAGMVEFATGYDKVTDISSVSLLLSSNDAWSQALSGYQGMNPSATNASDPLYEAFETMVKSKGAVTSLKSMSASAKNALSWLAKYMAIREYISPQDMESGKPLYLYRNVTSSSTVKGIDAFFIGSDIGPIEAIKYNVTNDPLSAAAYTTGGDAGGPKAVARVNGAGGQGTYEKFLGKTTSSEYMGAIEVSSAVFPTNMGSLTSYDAVSPYGKGTPWSV